MKKYNLEELSEAWELWLEIKQGDFIEWLEEQEFDPLDPDACDHEGMETGRPVPYCHTTLAQETPNKESSIRDSGSDSEQEPTHVEPLALEKSLGDYGSDDAVASNRVKLNDLIRHVEELCKKVEKLNNLKEGMRELVDATEEMVTEHEERIDRIDERIGKLGFGVERLEHNVKETIHDGYGLEERISKLEE